MITFYVPSVRKLPTGGNIYNREMIAYISHRSPEGPNLNVLETDGEMIPSPSPSPGGTGVAVVDSLVARKSGPAAGPELKELFSRTVMVVHYLKILDPSQRGSNETGVEEEFLSAYDGFITTSRYSRDILVSLGVRAESATAVTPGLNEMFRGPAPARKPSRPPRILTVSNLSSGKGLLSMVEVLEGIKELSWGWELVGTGELDGDYARRFRKRLEGSRVSSRVHLHGRVSRDDLVEIYDRSDLLVVPSRFETCSLVLMEAMSRSLPAVAFRVGGIPETVMGSDGVRLVPEDDWEAFGGVLAELIKDGSMRIGMGQQSRQTSENFPSWETAGHEFYESVING